MSRNVAQSLPRDANSLPLTDSDWGVMVKKSMTLAGGVVNDPGDYDGTGNPATLFTVTGEVLIRLLAICTTDLAGATATLEIGISGNTAGLIAQSTATDIDAGDIWHDATPDAGIEASTVLTERILANGADIIQTVATANITAGVIDYYCFWYPLSEDAKVVAA